MNTSEHEHLVDSLDGAERSLTGATVAGWEIMLAGGPDLFILTARAGERTANAITPDADPTAAIVLNVGGQQIEGPANYVLTRTEVLAALAELVAGELAEDRWHFPA